MDLNPDPFILLLFLMIYRKGRFQADLVESTWAGGEENEFLHLGELEKNRDI